MNTGFDTGKRDKNGKPIKIGDRVRYREYRESMRVTSTQDVWGRDVQLCRHEAYIEPEKEKITEGTVVYSKTWTGAVVIFNDYLLDSGNKEKQLYCIQQSGNEWLEVI